MELKAITEEEKNNNYGSACCGWAIIHYRDDSDGELPTKKTLQIILFVFLHVFVFVFENIKILYDTCCYVIILKMMILAKKQPMQIIDIPLFVSIFTDWSSVSVLCYNDLRGKR